MDARLGPPVVVHTRASEPSDGGPGRARPVARARAAVRPGRRHGTVIGTPAGPHTGPFGWRIQRLCGTFSRRPPGPGGRRAGSSSWCGGAPAVRSAFRSARGSSFDRAAVRLPSQSQTGPPDSGAIRHARTALPPELHVKHGFLHRPRPICRLRLPYASRTGPARCRLRMSVQPWGRRQADSFLSPPG